MEGAGESGGKQNGRTARRPCPKSDSEFNNYQSWKVKLRENCYKRVREDRTRLLWKLRLPSHQQEDIVNSAFQDIVTDEFNRMKEMDDDDDLLWEYQEGECQDQEMLLEMQRIFYEDLKSQPPPIQDLESQIETWEDEMDDYLSRALFDHMHLNEQDQAHRKEIWCPICKQGDLKDCHTLIYCTRCELQLNKANELTLEFLRDRLAEVHMDHLDRGCKLKPRFCIKTKFNLTALYIVCEGCDTFEVVM